MLPQNNRAFKEWAVVCDALKSGRQTVLIRKGGIREEEGVFRVDDSEFFLLPTYEHQDSRLLKPEFIESLSRIEQAGYDPSNITVDTYAVVDTIKVMVDEDQLRLLDADHIWNDEYVRMRLDFNPYDPLYVILLRVYRLPNPASIPMRPEYEGCKSWVTLEKPIPTERAVPVAAQEDFVQRKAAIGFS